MAAGAGDTAGFDTLGALLWAFDDWAGVAGILAFYVGGLLVEGAGRDGCDGGAAHSSLAGAAKSATRMRATLPPDDSVRREGWSGR